MTTSITSMAQIAKVYHLTLDAIFQVKEEIEAGTFDESSDTRFGEDTSTIAYHIGRMIRHSESARIRYREKAAKKKEDQAHEDLLSLIKPPRPDAVSETHILTLNIDTNQISNYIVLYPNTIYPRTVWNLNAIRFEDCLRDLMYSLDAKHSEYVLTFIANVMELRGEGWFNVCIGTKAYEEVDDGSENKIVVWFSIAKMVEGVMGDDEGVMGGDEGVEDVKGRVEEEVEYMGSYGDSNSKA